MLGRATFVFSAFALLAAASARADIRAEYVSDNGVPILTVEVGDDGRTRIGNAVQGYYLATEEGEFFVEPGPGGPRVLSLEAAAYLTQRSGFVIPEEAENSWRYEQAEAVRVGEWPGRAYRLVGDGVPGHLVPIAIADDPALAPLGQAMARRSLAYDARRGQPPRLARYEALMLKGALLRDDNRRLATVSFDPIPAQRFALPAEPLTLADVTVDETALPDAAGEADAPHPSVIQAVYWDGALWTMDDEGGLTRTPEGMQDGVPAEQPGPAAAICRSRSGLWLLSRGDPLSLWLREGPAGWQQQAAIPASPESHVLGLECSGDHPLVLFDDKVVLDGGQRVLPREVEPYRMNGYTSLLRIGETLYVGTNAGEWGGGLRMIDLASGASAFVRSSADEPLCGRNPEFSCDAVTGLAPDPAHDGCLLAAVGLVHFFPSGQLVQVCGDAARRAYRKPYTLDAEWKDEDIAETDPTVPFFGIAGNDGAAWAVGGDGLYRFDPTSDFELKAFPPVMPWGVDWSDPEVVLVPTDMNRRHSVSGGSLLLVPR